MNFHFHLLTKMKECVDILKELHLDFEYKLFDHVERREFIKEYFLYEVVLAYDALIPGAYKADLWRYCVLYIYGGLYIDIKMQCVNGFSLHSLLDKEYFINDGIIVKYSSILNGVMIYKKGNPLLLNSIINLTLWVALIGNQLDHDYLEIT